MLFLLLTSSSFVPVKNTREKLINLLIKSQRLAHIISIKITKMLRLKVVACLAILSTACFASLTGIHKEASSSADKWRLAETHSYTDNTDSKLSKVSLSAAMPTLSSNL